MSELNRTRLLLETWQPKPAKKSVQGKPYEEGKNLPNSIEEDIGTFSLTPMYSSKQLRRIKRMKHSKREHESTRRLRRKSYTRQSKRNFAKMEMMGELY